MNKIQLMKSCRGGARISGCFRDMREKRGQGESGGCGWRSLDGRARDEISARSCFICLPFGLDEDAGFRVVGVSNPRKLQEDVSGLAAQMEPALLTLAGCFLFGSSHQRFERQMVNGLLAVLRHYHQVSKGANNPIFIADTNFEKSVYAIQSAGTANICLRTLWL